MPFVCYSNDNEGFVQMFTYRFGKKRTKKQKPKNKTKTQNARVFCFSFHFVICYKMYSVFQKLWVLPRPCTRYEEKGVGPFHWGVKGFVNYL